MKAIDQISTIAVAGAGTMGSGIAQLAAQAGFKTVLYDVTGQLADKGLSVIRRNLAVATEKHKISAAQAEEILGRIQISSHDEDLTADVVIEAIIEKPEIKMALFRNIAGQKHGDQSIFCTNTSSIPVSVLADGIPYPERVAGMHFFNPAHLMKLVEVVSGRQTSEACAQTVFALALKMGKYPVMVKDRPGFIVNRIGKMYHTEPLKILEEQTAGAETIDRLLESSGFKMGPFKLMDLIGLDANLRVTQSLYELMNHEARFKPSELQQQLVDSGRLGRKSGHGFFDYDET